MVHEQPGLTIPPPLKKLGYLGLDSTEMFWDGFRVPADAGPRRAQERRARASSSSWPRLELGRVNVAARGLGLARSAFDHAIAYAQRARDVRQADRPAPERSRSSSPRWRRRSAPPSCSCSTRPSARRPASAPTSRPGWRSSSRPRPPRSARSTRCASTAASATPRTYPVERLYRDAPLLILGEGSNEIQHLIIARRLLERYAISLSAVYSRASIRPAWSAMTEPPSPRSPADPDSPRDGDFDRGPGGALLVPEVEEWQEPEGTASVGIHRVRKAYEQVDDQLRDLIMPRRAQRGASGCPNEAVLAREFGVSRGTVREALRVLAAQNLIRTAKGAGGGSFVTLPTADHISDFLHANISLLSESDDVTLQEFLEARELLEVFAARRLAARRTQEDIDRAAGDDRGRPGPSSDRASTSILQQGVPLRGAGARAATRCCASPPSRLLRAADAACSRSQLPDSFPRRLDDDHRAILEAIEARRQRCRRRGDAQAHRVPAAASTRTCGAPRPTAPDRPTG